MNYYSTRLLNDENLHILLKTLYEVKFNTIVNIIRKKKIKTFYLYKTKTIEIQQKIEELKKKNSLLQGKQDVETFHSKRMNLIMKQFLYLHDVIVKKHLR